MATDQRTPPTGSLTTDATFRAFMKDFSDSLKAAGATATSDTGQIDFTTVTKPANANTFVGYEVFKLTTDTKDSTLGLRFKIEYGSGSAAANPALAITVGTGSDGAGAINGTIGTRRTFPAQSGLTTGTTYTCGGDGRLIFVGQWNAGASGVNSNWIFIIERLRDNTGALTADGIYTFLAGPTAASTTSSYAETIRSGSISDGQVTSRFGATLQNASGNYVSNYYLSTHHPADRMTYGNPILSNLFYYHTDLTTGNNITVDRYSTSRTYKPIGRMSTASLSSNYQAQFGHDNGGLAILWE